MYLQHEAVVMYSFYLDLYVGFHCDISVQVLDSVVGVEPASVWVEPQQQH